jgi:hypothetical protein
MTIKSTLACDNEKCAKSLDAGAGRHWCLLITTQTIAMAKDSVPRHDAGDVMPEPKHFCDENCVAEWATARAADKAAAQKAFEERAAKENEAHVQ